QFYSCDNKLEIKLENEKGKNYKIKFRKKDDYDDIGLDFETYLIDKKHSCRNNCVFCFVDQLPKGMRDSLYFKDDDERLSFFFGNYVTLTNLSQHDVERIMEMHISPVNISVHTMNPELRVRMMKNKNAGESLKIIKQLAEAGIELNTQLVLCPGINDGEELKFSLNELAKLYPSVNTIAAVPLGVTKHREELEKLETYTSETAGQTIDIIEEFSNIFFEKHGTRLAYAADEFYIQAGREMPPYEFYEEFTQLENGVGMWALLKQEFYDCLSDEQFKSPQRPIKVTMATGTAAYPLINEFANKLQDEFNNLTIDACEIKNNFFGHTVTVAGLLTGQDLVNQLKGKELGDALAIPASMLKGTYPQDDCADNIFLDDMTLEQAEEQLEIRIIPLGNDGSEIVTKLLEVGEWQDQ
ncbi:MAG: DUF512 domain-containing protein, partial [Oscillospiraceae bacterium]